MPRDDSEVLSLVQQVKEGDGDAFGVIYDEYFDRIYAYVSFRVRSRPETEDLVQNVFLRALDALPRFENRGATFAGWLFRIAHNLVANHYRDNSRPEAIQVEEVESILAGEENTEDLALEAISTQRIHAAIGELTEDQQAVIVMKFLGGLNNEQIAEALGKPVGAVKSLQHRGLASLSRSLRGELGAAPDRVRSAGGMEARDE